MFASIPRDIVPPVHGPSQTYLKQKSSFSYGGASAIMSQETPAQRTVSTVSTATYPQSERTAGAGVAEHLEHGRGDGALPENEKDAIEDDWENDPENARNWSFRKKWTTVSIVCSFFSHKYLGKKFTAGIYRYHCILSCRHWLVR